MARDETVAQVTPVPAGVVQRVAAGLRYAVTGITPSDWFGPSQPLAPQAPASVTGRAFDYPVGYNVLARPRSEEPISFHQLRALADSYDLLRLIIETRKDQIEKLDWTLQQRPGSTATPDPAKLQALQRFLARPDGEHCWTQWLRLLLEDLLVLDAPTLYLRRTVGGQPYALEVIDGATIKRVLDERGRTPLPPSVAYQQVLKGLPAVDYAADELLYLPRNPRPHKIYGMGPVEQIVMTVNIALRKQVSVLNYYTEGNTPEALIGVPNDWTPDQISQFQAYWDSLLEGNLAARRHTKFVPGDLKYQPLREPVLKDDFDEWLARVVCFAFSLPPTAFVKQTNRATAETQQETATTEGLVPLQRWVKELLDRLLADYFGEPEIEFQWATTPSLDPLVQAQVNQIYLAAGVKSVAEVRDELGLGKNLLDGRPALSPAPVGKFNFDPNQARDDHGMWTSEDGSSGDAPATLSGDDEPDVDVDSNGVPHITIRPDPAPNPEAPNDGSGDGGTAASADTSLVATPLVVHGEDTIVNDGLMPGVEFANLSGIHPAPLGDKWVEKDPDNIPQSSKDALRRAMQLEGIPDDQYDDLAWIMTQESNGEVDERNHPQPGSKPSSARGLFQLTQQNYHFNPRGKKSFGNAVEEAQGGIRYILNHYKSVARARAVWNEKGKY
jgi:hypothetical protein